MLTTSARLLQVLSLLQARPRWTGPELADRLQLSPRSVRRDVDRLRSLGYLIDSDPGPAGGYRMRAGAALPPMQFDDREAVTIWAALAATTSGAVDGFEESALAALDKIDRLLPEHLRRQLDALSSATVTVAGATTNDGVRPDLLVTLARACSNRERLRLAYVDRDSNATDRRVDPYRLVSTGRRWYLVGFDVDRDAWRTLRVDRIVEATPTGHGFTFDDPPDAATMVSEATSVAPYRYSAVVTIDAAPDEVRRRVPATVAVITDLPDGRTSLVTGADSLLTIAGHLVAIGLPFEVLDPPELRRALHRIGAALVAAHRP